MMRIFLVAFCIFIGSISFAENISIYKLDNGQTVVIEQVKNNPIVTIDTWIKTGSINETDKNNGISHFLEHLFFKGTQTHPAGDFDKILESKGAHTNAGTSKDFTHYYITIASKYFAKALELHADMLLHPQIPRNEMEKERKVVIEEIAKDANSPTNICYENLNKLLYTTHPYKRKVIGTKKVVENVTRETILEYYKKYYAPTNMVTVIVGDVSPEETLDAIKKNFNSPKRKAINKSFKKERLLTSQKRNTAYMPTQSAYLMMGFRSVDVSSNDVYALDVLATILGEGRSSKLYQGLKEQKQLVNSISASNSTMKDDGIFIINSSFAPQNTNKVENAIFYEIDRIKNFGISENNLKIAKKIIETDTYYSRESVSNIAQEIGYTITLTGNCAFYNNYLSNIDKVTISDVKRVANKYLTNRNCALSFVLPESQKEPKVENNQTKTIHKSTLLSSEKNTSKYLLDNESTMLITDNKYNDIVAISILAKGGNFFESKRGTSAIFADLLMKGTKEYSSIELAKMFEENGINIKFTQNSDTFNINLLTTKKQVNLALKLLDEVLNNSSFDEFDLEKSRNLIANKIKQIKDDPLNLALDEYRAEIYKNSIYSKSTKLIGRDLPKIERRDIINYQKNILNPKNIVISINGNVNLNEVTNSFGEIFTPSKEQKFNYLKYSIPKIAQTTSRTNTIANQKTAWVIIGWQTEGVLSLKESATLDVMNTILGSGMSSRLFKSIREEEGLAYQVGSSYSKNILAGGFTLYAGTNPLKLDHTKQKMLNEITKLKTQFVSTKELSTAKERLLGEFAIALETNQDKANTIGWFEASYRGYDFMDKYITLINSVTISDIIEVANKYFNNNYVSSVVTTK